MHVARLCLNTTTYEEHVIERRFYAISHIHNVLVKHARKLLVQLKHNKEYQTMLSEYNSLLKKKQLSEDEKKRKTKLSKDMAAIRIDMGLSAGGFYKYIKVCGKQYRKLVSSQQVQKEADRVYEGVEKILFGNGKALHFKKQRDFNTISGKSNLNGARFDKETMVVTWIGLVLKCKLPKNESDLSYLLESLDHQICYCEIKRMMFPNGWHYYVLVYLKGDAPKKLNCIGTETMGIDPGVSTVAGVSDNEVILRELAPDITRYNKQIRSVLRHMDNSKRISNPKKYKPDGTIDKTNKDRWIYSKTYKKNANLLKSLYRKKSAYIKESHEKLCNELLENSINFIVEDMNYKGLQRKAKELKRSETVSEIKAKGKTRRVRKYKRRKRFGKSLNNRAPALFLTILKRKCLTYGGSFVEINTKTFKASQYNHMTDQYEKTPLKQREKLIGNEIVQRDLYSAFLIRNADSSLEKPDRSKCEKKFSRFVSMQNKLIQEMKQSNLSMKQCFGF